MEEALSYLRDYVRGRILLSGSQLKSYGQGDVKRRFGAGPRYEDLERKNQGPGQATGPGVFVGCGAVEVDTATISEELEDRCGPFELDLADSSSAIEFAITVVAATVKICNDFSP